LRWSGNIRASPINGSQVGRVCFAATSYRVGNAYPRRQVQVAVVADTVEISIGNELIRQSFSLPGRDESAWRLCGWRRP
jgi:hypothetical protein